MIVLLDTTELKPDLRLDGLLFEFLRSYLRQVSSSLIVPRIVFEETANHFREALTESMAEAQRTSDKLRRLLGLSDAIPRLDIDIDASVTQYRSQLEKRIRALGGVIVGFDEVAIGALVDRALQRRRPFDKKGQKGFRDALMWETLLKAIPSMTSGQQLALITRNSADFGKDEVLADDLRADCREVGAEDRVLLYHGLNSFVEKVVKPQLKKLGDVFAAIESEGRYKAFEASEFFEHVQPELMSLLDRFVQQWDFGSVPARLMGCFHTPRLHSLSPECTEWSVVDAWDMESGRISVALDFKADGEIECLESTESPYREGEEWCGYPVDDEFCGDAEFTLMMNIILESETGNLEDFEVHDTKIKLGYRWPYEEYG